MEYLCSVLSIDPGGRLSIQPLDQSFKGPCRETKVVSSAGTSATAFSHKLHRPRGCRLSGVKPGTLALSYSGFHDRSTILLTLHGGTASAEMVLKQSCSRFPGPLLPLCRQQCGVPGRTTFVSTLNRIKLQPF